MIQADPDLCPVCALRGDVYDSRNEGLGFRLRRHICPNDHRWKSRQYLDPAPAIHRPRQKRPLDVETQ